MNQGRKFHIACIFKDCGIMTPVPGVYCATHRATIEMLKKRCIKKTVRNLVKKIPSERKPQ